MYLNMSSANWTTILSRHQCVKSPILVSPYNGRVICGKYWVITWHAHSWSFGCIMDIWQSLGASPTFGHVTLHNKFEYCATTWYTCTCTAGCRFAPSQWETLFQSNAVSHRLGTNLESPLHLCPWVLFHKHNSSLIMAWIRVTMIFCGM